MLQEKEKNSKKKLRTYIPQTWTLTISDTTFKCDMTTNVKTMDNDTKVQIKKILVPIDGSECSLYAAKYATRIAKDENAQLYCIHVITSVPYGIANAPAIEEYFKDLEQKVQSWFDKVRDMAKNECIPDLKTETFTDVNSVIGSIIDYATTKDIDLIVIGTRGRTGLKRFFMGSVASGVVRHAHCPILLVR
jgi:nucleotide-binding universal stress UspA family protein